MSRKNARCRPPQHVITSAGDKPGPVHQAGLRTHSVDCRQSLPYTFPCHAQWFTYGTRLFTVAGAVLESRHALTRLPVNPAVKSGKL